MATLVGAGLSLSGLIDEASLDNQRLLAGQFLLFGGQACAQVKRFRVFDYEARPRYQWGNGLLALVLCVAAGCVGYLYFAAQMPDWVSAIFENA